MPKEWFAISFPNAKTVAPYTGNTIRLNKNLHLKETKR